MTNEEYFQAKRLDRAFRIAQETMPIKRYQAAERIAIDLSENVYGEVTERGLKEAVKYIESLIGEQVQ